MAKIQTQRMKRQSKTAVANPALRVALPILIPVLGAALLQTLAGGSIALAPGNNNAPLLAGAGLASWLLGLRWYGIPGMGLRGKRPLFSGIGFATLGWVVVLLALFYAVPLQTQAGNGRLFIYILLFEAFAAQLWAFGLLFRAIADWRGGLTAAIGSGLFFGAVAFLLFQEATYSSSLFSLIYFAVWGVMYGIIRLRTGSLLGVVIIQTLQSFTAWVVLVPPPPLPDANLPVFYLVATLGFMLIIWRLWPKVIEDYRI